MAREQADYVGTCGFCSRQYFHLSARDRKLSDHGYQIPDWGGGGWRTGSCPGSHHSPTEVSPETIEMRFEAEESQLKSLLKILKDLPRATEISRMEKEWNRQALQYVPVRVSYKEGDPKFMSIKERLLQDTENDIRHVEKALVITESDLARWKPSTTPTAQKIEAAEAAEKASKRKNLQQERFEKHFLKNQDRFRKLYIQLLKREQALYRVPSSEAEYAIYQTIQNILGAFNKTRDILPYTDLDYASVIQEMDIDPLIEHLGIDPERASLQREEQAILKELGVYSSWEVKFNATYPGFMSQVKK